MEQILNTVFNPAQLYMLQVMSQVRDDNELNNIKDIIAKHFADKALDAIDQLWEDGTIDEGVIESWKHEHMRTPYK